MAVAPWIKKYEDLKLRTPAKMIEWMETHLKPRINDFVDSYIQSVDAIFKYRYVNSIEAAFFLQTLLRAAGYTSTVAVIQNDFGDVRAVVIIQTGGSFYWVEGYWNGYRGVHEYAFKAQLYNAVRAAFLKTFKGYTAFNHGPGIQAHTDCLTIELVINTVKTWPAVDTVLTGDVILVSVLVSDTVVYEAFDRKFGRALLRQYFQMDKAEFSKLDYVNQELVDDQLVEQFAKAVFSHLPLPKGRSL